MSAILPRLNPATLRVVGEPPSESGAIDLTVGDLIWMVGAEKELRREAELRATRARREGFTVGWVLGLLAGLFAGGIVIAACLRFGWLS